ncbi:MAG: hypothetical protein EXS39_07605 [Opitutaceae bacterium]|nr:hypothetical protein [Opitutaceae bacterium]
MVNTAISSLAQNLDGPDWPIKGKEETAAKYVDLNYDQLLELLALKGLSTDKADLLIGILKDTLAFDNPFGDMVVQTEAAEKKDNQLLKNMARLEIPQEFPITLTGLSSGTLEFCKLEKLSTLGEFAVFAQNMSQNVIVGGDFRKLLNALSHIDERSLAEFLPFRSGSRGLHLIEALAQAATKPVPATMRLRRRSGLRLSWTHSKRTSPAVAPSRGTSSSWVTRRRRRRSPNCWALISVARSRPSAARNWASLVRCRNFSKSSHRTSCPTCPVRRCDLPSSQPAVRQRCHCGAAVPPAPARRSSWPRLPPKPASRSPASSLPRVHRLASPSS